MNAKEELTKLLMESYDRGVADAKQAAMETFAVAINAAVRVEREALLDLVDEYAKNNTDLADAIRARGNT